MSSPFQKAFSAKSPLKDKDKEELSAYQGAAAEDIPGYDDGAGGFDYEAMAKANQAPGTQYTDAEANAAFDKMKYITDANIRKGAGADLGIIKNKSK